MFSGLLKKAMGFKYRITVKVLLKKCKLNGEIKFGPVYFNSVTKTVISHRFRLESKIFKKFYTWLMFGLMKDLAGMMNQSSLNTSIFLPIDHYQEVLT